VVERTIPESMATMLTLFNKRFDKFSEETGTTIDKVTEEVRDVERAVTAFDIKVEVVTKKFKRLNGDWLKLSERIEKQADNINI
jgi:uncharacterized protein Yka (UPF0111/DUF47 family)